MSKLRYYRTNAKIDLERLLVEANALAWDDTIKQYRLQTAVQNADGNEDYLEGTGSKPGQTDDKWANLRSDLSNTWWETFFASLPWRVYRTRIMIMPPRTCYSIHSDTSPRLHIALKTHPQAKFIFTNPPELMHVPADGYVWWVDTREEHTAINGSMEPRWHLLLSLVNTLDH